MPKDNTTDVIVEKKEIINRYGNRALVGKFVCGSCGNDRIQINDEYCGKCGKKFRQIPRTY